ncbi:[citrate (pro-3S)-lyase] ligase [Clostridium sp. DL1XJH146]
MENLQMKSISLRIKSDKKKLDELLEKSGLKLDKFIEKTIGIYDGDRLLATGSISGNTLRCIAVDEDYKGGNIINKLISELINLQYQRGRTHLFIFTKYEAYKSFEYMGFKKISEVDEKIVLLENKQDGISNYLKEISKCNKDGKIISSIVMNCNPFTLGHQYLIEQASRESDVVHIFVVWEDKSTFPSETRYKLIKEGTKHLDNVIIHKGKNYIISNATFPTYFIKDDDEVVELHAKLDIQIFRDFIAPALKINRRYVGEENYDVVTRKYNDAMKELLPQRGIEVIEMKRKEEDEDIISASKVRRFLKEEDWEKIKKIVPESTYKYLRSKEAQPIINKIKEKDSRH